MTLSGCVPHGIGPFIFTRCSCEALVASPSQLDGQRIDLRHNSTDRYIGVPQTPLQLPQMTQLALRKTTGAALVFLHAEMLHESLPTALKVGVSHQCEPQVPIRQLKSLSRRRRQDQGTLTPHR